MTVTLKGSLFDTNAGNKTVTATPAVGDLIVVVIMSTGAGVTLGVTDNNTDGLGAYTAAGANVTHGTNTSKLNIYARNAAVGSATSTVFTAAEAGSNGGGLAVYSISAAPRFGASAFRSVGSQGSQTLGTTPAPVLSLTPLSGNPIITAVNNGSTPGGVTARTGYTRDVDTSYLNPSTGIDTAWLLKGETSATITWGGTSATAFSSYAVEIDIHSALTAGPLVVAATAADTIAGSTRDAKAGPLVVSAVAADTIAGSSRDAIAGALSLHASPTIHIAEEATGDGGGSTGPQYVHVRIGRKKLNA